MVAEEAFNNKKPALQKIYDSAIQMATDSLGEEADPELIHQEARAIALKATQKALKEKPDLTESRDADSRTLLHVASGWGFFEAFDYLVANGVKKLARDFSGKTVAHNPARFGKAEMITHLCQVHGIDVNQPDVYGFTPLDHAQYMLLTKTPHKRSWCLSGNKERLDYLRYQC